MAVEFRLLGDVEARLDGQQLEIGHARQRCVLVALLVEVNRPIPLDQLVDRVWADQPPHRARNALGGLPVPAATCACRRRRGDCPPAGWLRADDRRVIGRPAPLPALGAEARATADPLDAASLLDAALDLWRGEPFASLDTPWVNDVRTALQVERLSVALDRNDAALRAGRHAELLGELVTALHAHPLDERLAGQLMLAQYRCGRQADALQTYRQMRDRLVEELGVDPSPSLREVHQQILDGDPGFDLAVSSGPRRSRTRPPHSSSPTPGRTRICHGVGSSFIGREQQVLHVTDALRQGPLVTLTGVGGTGKSRLALEAVGLDQRALLGRRLALRTGPSR